VIPTISGPPRCGIILGNRSRNLGGEAAVPGGEEVPWQGSHVQSVVTLLSDCTIASLGRALHERIRFHNCRDRQAAFDAVRVTRAVATLIELRPMQGISNVSLSASCTKHFPSSG
jgi:hypothetical protein